MLGELRETKVALLQMEHLRCGAEGPRIYGRREQLFDEVILNAGDGRVIVLGLDRRPDAIGQRRPIGLEIRAQANDADSLAARKGMAPQAKNRVATIFTTPCA